LTATDKINNTKKTKIHCNTTSGLAQRGQEARRKGSAKMNSRAPHDRLWKPPLRQAASPLGASGESAVDNEVEN